MYVEEYPAPALVSGERGENLVRGNHTSFPRCSLQDRRVVDSFPAGCALAQPNPLAALLELKDRAFARWGNHEPGGTEDHARYDICTDCVPEALRNPTVRQLRQSEIRDNGADQTSHRPRAQTRHPYRRRSQHPARGNRKAVYVD